MKLYDATESLRSLVKESNRYVFRTGDLARLFNEPRTDKRINETLRRLVRAGTLVRPTRGVYVVSEFVDNDVLKYIALAARRNDYLAISLETAAYTHGLVTQLFPSKLTLITTGREGLIKTSWGSVEFVHTAMTREALSACCEPYGLIPLTDKKTTLLMLNRARRNSRVLVKEAENELR